MSSHDSSRTMTPNRRQVLQGMGLTLCTLPWLDRLASTVLAADTPVARNGFPRMVHEFFVQQVRNAHAEHSRRYRELKTREDAEQYVKMVQAAIRECFGPEPERADLQAASYRRAESRRLYDRKSDL